MNTLIRKTSVNGIESLRVTDNDGYLADCIASLARNNTFVPGIARVLYNDPVTKVWFKDGTSVTIKASKDDAFSKDVGLCYAIVKRLFGVPDEKGEIQPCGFMNRLKKIVDSAYDQKKSRSDNSTEIDEHAEYEADPVAFCAKHAPIGPDNRPDHIRAEKKRMKREQMENARADKANNRKPSLAKTVEDLANTVKCLETVVASMASRQQ